jgi:hypothetical protein
MGYRGSGLGQTLGCARGEGRVRYRSPVSGARRSAAGRFIVLVLLLTGSGGVARADTFVSTNAGGNALRARPAAIHLVSNDGLEHLRWSSWGGSIARGSGVDDANNPDPGHAAVNAVRVELVSRKRCGSLLVYTAIRLRFTRGVPYLGERNPMTFAYGCPPTNLVCSDFQVQEGEVNYTWLDIRAHLTSCTEAQRVLAAFFSGQAMPLPNAGEGDAVLGWRCRTGPAVPGPSGTPAKCTRGAASISASWM